MSQTKISISSEVETRLRKSLMQREDLVTLVRGAPKEIISDEAKAFRIRGSLPIPRLMDPETAEMRILEILVRPIESDHWEIFAIEGLDD
ncbi:MAG: hypothetical protein K0U98_16050 [Deltaproteobacteria bacterium]|nr:hypothetical protein [Deltaproteobacteria bacterium]